MTEDVITALREDDEQYEIHLGYGAEFSPTRISAVGEIVDYTIMFSGLRHYNAATPPIALGQIFMYLRKNKIDILHTRGTEAGIIGRWAGTLARTPIILHGVRGVPFSPDHPKSLNTFLWAMERVSDNRADYLIADSYRTRSEFLRRGIGIPEQFEVIHPGIPIKDFSNATPQKVGDPQRPTIIFVGRMERTKGVFDLLDAFFKVDPYADLGVVGGGDRETVADYISPAFASRIHLLGFRDDIPSLMKGADLFVLPTYREGFCRVITEAMAAGLPVICTPVGGIPERVTDGVNGFLVEPGDVTSLGERLEQLLSDPELRHRIGKKAEEGVGEYSVEEMKKKSRQLYREVISSL